MTRPFRKRFLDKMCEWDWLFSLVLTVDVVLLILLGLSFYLMPPSGGTRVISLLALGLLLGSLIIATAFLRVCHARESTSPDSMDA